MATPSRIGIENENGSITSIYCHWDGYTEGVGATLKEHYLSTQKVRMLLNLGDISILGEQVATMDEHTFDNPKEGITLAYHRDRGEVKREARTDVSIEQFKNRLSEAYGYVYSKGGNWLTIR
jgi:hypothetical protein